MYFRFTNKLTHYAEINLRSPHPTFSVELHFVSQSQGKLVTVLCDILLKLINLIFCYVRNQINEITQLFKNLIQKKIITSYFLTHSCSRKKHNQTNIIYKRIS